MQTRYNHQLFPTSQQDPLKAELDATVQAYEACGYRLPTDITIPALFVGIGGAFMPTELPPADHMPDVGPETKQYFGREVQPSLANAAETGDLVALTLARQTGRLLSVAREARLYTQEDPLPFDLRHGTMFADGTTHRYDIQVGHVVDYGMGINGLFTHLNNVRSGEYRVTAIQKTHAEKAALEGIIEHQQIDRDQLSITEGGISSGTDTLLAGDGPANVDMIIASRVHGAGRDLDAGIRMASTLLRSDGILIARGPRRYPAGTNYDTVQQAMRNDPKLRVVRNEVFFRTMPNGFREPNRVIVARKK